MPSRCIPRIRIHAAASVSSESVSSVVTPNETKQPRRGDVERIERERDREVDDDEREEEARAGVHRVGARRTQRDRAKAVP